MQLASQEYFTGRGDHVVSFTAEYIRQTMGRWAGQPLLLEQYQQDLLNELYLEDENGKRVYREALIGLSRKNGKSTMCAAIALYELLYGEPGGQIFSAAASRDQARIVFDTAKKFVKESPKLQDYLTVMRDCIVCNQTDSIYRVLSADGALQHGLNPSMVIIDELHAWTRPSQIELYYALTTGSLARESPLFISITTAGYDRDSICWQQYDRGKALEVVGGVDAMRKEGYLFRWWEAPAGCDVTDLKAAKQANPASWITEERLEIEAKKLPSNVYRQVHLGQWVDSAGDWLPPEAWGECVEQDAVIPLGGEVWLGVDIGVRHDSSAVVVLHPREDGKVVVEARIWDAPGDGGSIDLGSIEAHIQRLSNEYTVRGVGFDPRFFERSSQFLSSIGLWMVEFDQSVRRMTEATVLLHSAIKEKRVVHHGYNHKFNKHVQSGAVLETEGNLFRLSKGKSGAKIDALIALAIGYFVQDKNMLSYDPEPVVWI